MAVAPRMLFFANLGWAIDRLEVTHVTCTPSLWQSLERFVDELSQFSQFRWMSAGHVVH